MVCFLLYTSPERERGGICPFHKFPHTTDWICDNLQLSCVCADWQTDGFCARARIFRTGVRFRYVKPRNGT